MNNQRRTHTMIKTLTATAIVAAAVLVGSPAAATDECYTGQYQGAPIEVCPPPIPDPTNCYTGWYQGAPQEVCMPTGWVPGADWTFNGQPLVIHVSKDYVAPVVVDVVVVAPMVAAPTVAKVVRAVWAPETVRQAEPRA